MPDNPQPGSARAERKQFRLSVRLTALLLVVAVCFTLGEALVRFASNFGRERVVAAPVAAAPLYSAEELRPDLPRFTAQQGRDCITIRPGFHWDPRFGFASKTLDKDCAHKLFAAYKTSVVLMGGSAMENTQAPNYLTSIDTYAFGNDASIASLNLAESGARHANMLARFLYEVVELHPTYAVFLDGFNEFASIHYGGDPEDDFYWTAGVKDRVANPLKFYRDKLFEWSRLLELLALKTGLINSARIVHSDIDLRQSIVAADYYLKTRAYTETICQAYGIKCVFIIQPTALLDKTPSAFAKIAVAEDLRSFPRDIELFRMGYDHILRKAGDKVLDATQVFAGKDAYIDVVHFNKIGSRALGEFIRAALH